MEEPEKLKERQGDRDQAEAIRNEDVREAKQMVDVVEQMAEQGRRESAEELERLKVEALREKEAVARRLHREDEEKRRLLEEVKRLAALKLRAQQEAARVKAEAERKEAEVRRQSEVVVKERQERAAAEQRALADARQAEEAGKEQRRVQAERAAKADAERAVRALRDAELSAKQEKEREERARWMVEQQRTRAASAPASPPSPSSAPPAAASSSASVSHPSAEMRRLEEEAVRKAKEQQQLEERKERIIVQEERDRLARAAEKEKAEQQQRQEAAAKAAEVERKRAEAALQEQRRAEAKRQEEEKRKQEETAKLAAVEAERQRKKNEEVQRIQRQQQEEVIRTLQQRAAAAQPPLTPSTAARASVVVINPGTPPPPPVGGSGQGGPVIIATPAPPVVKTDLSPKESSSRTPSWLPYALIALGGGLVGLFVWRRQRAVPSELIVATVTETVVPAAWMADGGVDEDVVEEVVWSVALPEVQRQQLRKAAEPPELTPLPPPPPVPEVSEEELAQVVSATSVPASPAPDLSSDSPQPLQQLLGQLEGLHLQQLLSSLSDLHSEEANHLRAKIRSTLTDQLQQLAERVKELKSGVEVSVAAPLISHHEQSTGQQQSIDELKAYLASLRRQHDFLTKKHSPQPASTDASDTASPSSSSQSSSSSSSTSSPASSSPPSSASLVSLNAERAKSEVERQMAASFTVLLREVEQQAEQLTQQAMELERSIASQLMQRRLQQTVEQRVHEAVEEERERWRDVENSELRQQRDDLLALTRLYLQRQRAELDRANDEERRKRMEEVDSLAGRMRSFLASFQRIVDDTKDSDHLHQVALAALALDSLSREEEVEKEEESGRQRLVVPGAAASSGLVAEWRRLWRLRSSDAVIDAVVSSIPSHVLTEGLPSVPQLKRRWRRVQAALKEEAFVPKAAEEEGHGRSPWAQLVGKAFSLLYLSATSASAAGVEVEEGGEVGVIDRMNAMVGEKRWGEVLRLEALLSPTCRALCEQWTQQVQDRLVVEQALQAVKARVICLSCGYDT